MSFKNKVVIVTGSSSGIGAAIAIAFAKENANVVLVGRNKLNLDKIFDQCNVYGKDNLVIVADVSKDEAVKIVIDKTIKKFGKIDILINNAGILRLGTLLDGKMLAAYDEVMSTNLRATIQLTMLSAPYLIKTGGNVINMSSIAGLTVTLPSFGAYCISKAAMDHFTRNAALELGPHGVRVNSVNPGPVVTEILANSGLKDKYTDWNNFISETLLGRVGEAEEIADLTMFLASDKAKSITGSVYVSDNGMLLKR